MHTSKHMEAIGLLADVGHDDMNSEPQPPWPTKLTVSCTRPCGRHGVCNKASGLCMCQAGWAGIVCEEELFPACRLSADIQPEPAVHHPCASMRFFAPVACECFAQCLAAGHEICAPYSFGCQTPWRANARRGRGGAESTDMGTRAGFHDSLPCYAHPANLSRSVHSGLPADRSARMMNLGSYLRVG